MSPAKKSNQKYPFTNVILELRLLIALLDTPSKRFWHYTNFQGQGEARLI